MDQLRCDGQANHNSITKDGLNGHKGLNDPSSSNLTGRRNDEPADTQHADQVTAKTVNSQDEHYESFEESDDGYLSPSLKHYQDAHNLSNKVGASTVGTHSKQKLILKNDFELLKDDEIYADESGQSKGDISHR